jgi:citrate synthase
MAVEEAKPKAGLEDVVAATSSICYLDGARGVLAYYGYDIHDLARGATFEETCYLLWHGRLPNRAELGDLQSQLAAARPLSEPILRFMRQLPPSDGMDMLRTLTSAWDSTIPRPTTIRRRRSTARRSASPRSWAASSRPTAGCRRAAADPAGSGARHAANFLYMLKGSVRARWRRAPSTSR